jgi:two-component system response regulator AtoC
MAVDPKAHTPGLERRRILIAEDDEDMRHLVGETLSRDGYQVQEAADGTLLQARAALPAGNAREPFDLIISDIRLPGLTGLEVLERLRRAGRKVPVILMTAFVDERTLAMAASLGSVLISKPFELDDLRQVVRRLLPA